MPDEAELALLEKYGRPSSLYRPVGCAACNHVGYRGRSGIYELLVLDNEMRSMIHDRDHEQKLRAYADQKGMYRLREDAMRWVLSGETSLEEVIRVTRD